MNLKLCSTQNDNPIASSNDRLPISTDVWSTDVWLTFIIRNFEAAEKGWVHPMPLLPNFLLFCKTSDQLTRSQYECGTSDVDTFFVGRHLCPFSPLKSERSGVFQSGPGSRYYPLLLPSRLSSSTPVRWAPQSGVASRQRTIISFYTPTN